MSSFSIEDRKTVAYMLLCENKTIPEICEAIGRKSCTGQFKLFVDTIREKNAAPEFEEGIFDGTINMLVDKGLTKEESSKLIVECLSLIHNMTDPKEAVQEIIKGAKFTDLIKTTSDKNRSSNIVIMNEASSMKIDNFRNRKRSISSNDNMYKIKQK